MRHAAWTSWAAQTAVALAAFTGLAPAQAGLVGDTVNCAASSTAVPPITCGPPSAVVVSPGREFNVFETGSPDMILDVDLDALTIRLTRVLLGAGGELQFFPGDALSLSSLNDVDAPGRAVLDSVTLTALDGVTGLEAADLSFTDDALFLDLSDVVFAEVGSSALIEVSFRRIPEPGSLALAGLASLAGLSGLALTRARLRRGRRRG